MGPGPPGTSHRSPGHIIKHQHQVGPLYRVAAVGGLVSVAHRAGMAVGEARVGCVVQRVAQGSRGTPAAGCSVDTFGYLHLRPEAGQSGLPGFVGRHMLLLPKIITYHSKVHSKVRSKVGARRLRSLPHASRSSRHSPQTPAYYYNFDDTFILTVLGMIGGCGGALTAYLLSQDVRK